MTCKFDAKSMPQVIFFDAMGTLFGLKSSVGEIYQRYAAKYHVIADADEINSSFAKSFQLAPPLAFSSNNINSIQQQEVIWWSEVVSNTFAQLELAGEFSDFTEFFGEIYEYFATAHPWCVFPDVLNSLQKWQDRGVELGIISNFDSRLIEVLKVLNLEQFFHSITISSTAGLAKPEAGIFAFALNKHGALPNKAWHVGDSFVEDYQGAKNAGLSPFWLNRDGISSNIENQLPNLSSLG